MSNQENFVPLGREQRKICWLARDEFFHFLDSKQLVDPAEENVGQDKVGAALRKDYEEKCPSSWVKYFNDLRFRQAHMGEVQKTGNRLL
ncbi:hypothetical protein K493DRAFT_2057 [Basidiobolus meristosporus CBS 931.73]|uniref:Cytochrome c oxidase, subunit VIb n=1 Tax=Basidiobolus meristosporus CBS 931.73 TaxID=1314790 RepID=A0A1Y1WQE0_9FUNG|nr:hypothetical protein K493DRAFT_2057 [Basidiobolus meristosporus CBS 931.73]|eukprot:ORX75486.1 hypothetical protein K493DRAFT_2057 [Basidiobolus meristosporus CBS 931.73]